MTWPTVQELVDLIGKLLVFNPSRRLGTLSTGAAGIKAHPWFANFDWELFAKREMPAPYVPEVRQYLYLLYSSGMEKHLISLNGYVEGRPSSTSVRLF